MEDKKLLVDYVAGNSSLKLWKFLEPIKIVKDLILKNKGWVVNPTN